MTRKRDRKALLAALTLSLALLAGCSSDGNDSTEVPAADDGTDTGDTPDGGAIEDEIPGEDDELPEVSELKTVVIDASAGGFGTEPEDPANKWTYFNFDTGQIVELSDEAAEQSTEWHMAFKRVAIKVNSGASGPGMTTAAIVDAQTRLYDEEGMPDVALFTSATAETELAALDRPVDISTLVFSSDSDIAALNSTGLDSAASWWSYDPSAHSVNANPDVWYVVRSASGDSFAKLRVTDIVQEEKQISVEMFLQGPGEGAFSTSPVVWTAVIGNADGAVCYDFDEPMQVDCDSSAADWDLQLEVADNGRSWNAWVNGGVIRGDGTEGAAFGPLSALMQQDFSDASSVPTWFTDESGGVFQESSWYAYSLQGSNRIWPNYRVYGIDAGESMYKLQILSYYDAAGSSGVLTLRYASMN